MDTHGYPPSPDFWRSRSGIARQLLDFVERHADPDAVRLGDGFGCDVWIQQVTWIYKQMYVFTYIICIYIYTYTQTFIIHISDMYIHI